jgi:hypothetical protein
LAWGAVRSGLKEAQCETRVQQSNNERLECEPQNAKATETRNRPDPLFRRMALNGGAPEWLAIAVRRAYRKRLHPDVHPLDRKVEAERRYKEAEHVFDEIWKLRGFHS